MFLNSSSSNSDLSEWIQLNSHTCAESVMMFSEDSAVQDNCEELKQNLTSAPMEEWDHKNTMFFLKQYCREAYNHTVVEIFETQQMNGYLLKNITVDGLERLGISHDVAVTIFDRVHDFQDEKITVLSKIKNPSIDDH
ncbi:hypothetical protein C9374_004068 [Naegleria lovaniensis]|uniref:SAM domain-containing protein n=1 Tax=Naegleria lovaniensis TaxID=51637 RepID=A0AA88GRT4_NAELO|nr:uncharacterized protein C9374_004068 [Naegleria lovaniensis]KAG2383397.1 hypothetical protein C9374_004068 [Naegleria lovaniensis]